MNRVINTTIKLLYDEIKPNDCKSLQDGIGFAYDCSPEIYFYESLGKVRKDLEGDYESKESKYKLSLAVGHFFGNLVVQQEIDYNSKEYADAKIFTGALALAYRVNPKELFDYFFNWEFCQTF